MRALVILAVIVATIGYGIEKMSGEGVTSANCVGAVQPIDPSDCAPDPPSPDVDGLSDDDVSLPAVAACDNVQLRLEDEVYVAAGVGGGALTCP